MRIGIALTLAVLLFSFHPSGHAGEAAAKRVALRAKPFPLNQVRLLPGPFADAMERDRRYLHELEADRLLHPFRENAGLPAPGEPMGGWERLEVRGHTLGHYLSACAMMVASTGDEKLKAKADRIVAELAKCQQALGPSGYLSGFPESFIERAEARKPVWAPYYTLHKIMAGLLDMHVHCQNQQALEVVEKMAAWCKSRCDKLSDDQMQQMLNRTEQGGMNDVLASLYAVTGNPDHLALSRRFVQNTYNDPLAEGRDELKGQHVNSFVPNMIGTARQYEMTGDQRDHDVAHFFWHQVTGKRCYSTGGTSNYEHWRTDPDVLSTELSPESQESCCTYNMLKLTRHLFTWDPQPVYADYYERALVNSILSTQDPETGMMMYHVALNPGHWKIYNTPRDSFWCCTGTGIENHARYGEAIYFHDDEGLYVNLFIPSALNWSEKGLRIEQQTKFPESDRTLLVFHCDQPVELTLRIRCPYWTTSDVEIHHSVKGGPTEPLLRDDAPLPIPGLGYFSFRRRWQEGEQVEIRMPMRLHLERMPDDPTLATIMYGPLVLAGELGTEKLTPEMFYAEGQRDYSSGPSIEVPMLVVPDDDPGAWIEPLPDRPLTFRTVGAGRPNDVTLIPYHMLFGQRYSVYWRIVRDGSPEHRRIVAEQEARRARLARTVDAVQIGVRTSEQEHGFRGESTQSGFHRGRSWRHATDGGSFSYELAVAPDVPMILCCTYWGSDVGARTFDVLIDGQRIATQTLNRNKPDEFFEVEHPIPAELIRGKKKVTVKFQGHPGNIAGGVFGCEMLR
jgi:DUF1680 family protein